MERDSLKIKLAEVESELKAYHVQYDGDMDDEEDRAPSPSKLLRTLSSSTSNNAVNRSWRDHRNALESELERVEKELDECKILLEAERSKVEELTDRERSTFEKAATLEAISASLKARLEDSERATKDAVKEKDSVQCDYDAMKLEVGELRQLMLKQQNLVDLVGKKRVGSAGTSKNEMREARLEKVRQRAREQMKLDTSVLEEKKERAKEGLEEKEREREKQEGRQANIAQIEAIRKLEGRLTKAEVNGERLQFMLQAEQEKSKYQHELLLMQQQQQQSQQVVAAPAIAQPQIIYQQVPVPQSGSELRPSATLPPDVFKAGVEKLASVPETKATKEAAKAQTAVSEPPVSSWEKEYHDFIVEKEQEQAQQQAAVLQQQAASKLELEKAEQRFAETRLEAEREKEKSRRLQEEGELAALKAAEKEAAASLERERRQSSLSLLVEQQKQLQKQHQHRHHQQQQEKAEKDSEAERERQKEAEKQRRAKKEEEEKALWEAKENERRLKKEVRDCEERSELRGRVKKDIDAQNRYIRA